MPPLIFREGSYEDPSRARGGDMNTPSFGAAESLKPFISDDLSTILTASMREARSWADCHLHVGIIRQLFAVNSNNIRPQGIEVSCISYKAGLAWWLPHLSRVTCCELRTSGTLLDNIDCFLLTFADNETGLLRKHGGVWGGGGYPEMAEGAFRRAIGLG